MPDLTFPMATLVFFQFVFAAITVIILAGSVLRAEMNFKAWVIFCPVWMTCVYVVGAFSLWGGGWLATLGAVDFSGGYVVHLAAGTSAFVAAWSDRPAAARRTGTTARPTISWWRWPGPASCGWAGTASTAAIPTSPTRTRARTVLNTNVSTATALLVWTIISDSAWPELVQFLTETECTTTPNKPPVSITAVLVFTAAAITITSEPVP